MWSVPRRTAIGCNLVGALSRAWKRCLRLLIRISCHQRYEAWALCQVEASSSKGWAPHGLDPSLDCGSPGQASGGWRVACPQGTTPLCAAPPAAFPLQPTCTPVCCNRNRKEGKQAACGMSQRVLEIIAYTANCTGDRSVVCHLHTLDEGRAERRYPRKYQFSGSLDR
jgi:hypothetical protein